MSQAQIDRLTDALQSVRNALEGIGDLPRASQTLVALVSVHVLKESDG